MDEDFSSNSSIIKKEDYITNDDWNFLQDFIKDKETPYLVLSKKKAEDNYNRLKSWAKNAKIYYAVKACPNKEIIKSFIALWSYFDIASIY